MPDKNVLDKPLRMTGVRGDNDIAFPKALPSCAGFNRRKNMSALFLVFLLPGRDNLPAFPGAEGFGSQTTGGRGGRVVHVTNLNPRGPGSFAWAVNEVKEPRTIVFDVSGVIDCRDEISFRIDAANDHVTIAGETSPGGVAIYNYRNFVIRDGAEQVILRFLRFRGTRIHPKNDPDGLLISHAKNVIVDHCSFAGACDETISASDVQNVTIQWTGFDESRKEKAHSDYFNNDGQWHNYGGLFSRARDVSIHHCLFAHQSKRNPLASKMSYVEAVNNVIYNYSNSQQTWGVEGDGVKVAACYFKLGPDRRKRPIPVRDNVIAIRDCVSKDHDGSPGPRVDDLGEVGKLNLKSLQTAEEAYEEVLRQAGALPHDATSARMVRETQTGTGRQGYVADLVADRAALKTVPVPKDSDKDGVPDHWEKARGLDPNDPADAVKLSPSGYSHLELYCHERASRLIDAAKQNRSK
jgi:large repetitive protein